MASRDDASRLIAGRYRLDRHLASGGLSRVWLATDTADGSTVAVKRATVPDALTAEEARLVGGLILGEARAFARVDHRNVVRIRDVVPDGDEPWIVMDYIASRSLQQVVAGSGAMHPRRAAEIGLQVLAGLNAVFRAGILHLDMKPGNVLIADDSRVLLSDFGPVVTASGVRTLTEHKIILGSPNYVAPERLFDGISTPQADLWSLGATLYFAVEGRPPFRRETTDDTLRALSGRRPDPMLRAGPLTPVIAGLMRAEPDDRLSAAAAGRLLRRVAGTAAPAPASSPAPVRQPAVVVPPAPVPAYRRPALVAAAVLAVAVAALGVAAGVRTGTGAQARSAAPPPVTSPAATPPAFAPPDGWVWHRDQDAGFRVALPRSWRAEDTAGLFTSSAPGDGPVLRVRLWSPPPQDQVIGLIGIESAAGLDAYRRLRIDPPTSSAGAVWEYTYRAGGAAYRAQDQVVTSAGRTYRITWVCPRGDWSADLAAWRTVLDSFGPLTGA